MFHQQQNQINKVLWRSVLFYGLCLISRSGNFYRAKRAMERQKQRRQEHNYLQNLEQQPLQSQGLGGGTTTNYRNTNHTNSDYSPKSAYSSSSSSGPTNTTTGIQQLQQQLHQRRNNNNNNNIYNTSVGNDRNNNSIDDDETDITVDLIMWKEQTRNSNVYGRRKWIMGVTNFTTRVV